MLATPAQAPQVKPYNGCGKYNPEEYGAQCERCYLYKYRQGGPVPGEFNTGAKFTVAAEAPGEEEVEHGVPLIGKSGQTSMKALAASGYRRQDVNLTNTFLCRPPGNDLDQLLRRMKKDNAQRIATGQLPYLSPMEACRPRFVNDLRQTRDVLTFGKIALSSVIGQARSIMDIRGASFEGVIDEFGRFRPPGHEALTPGGVVSSVRIGPTIHPAFALHSKRYLGVFYADVSKITRWFSGALQWKEPTIYYNPSPEQLEYFLLKYGAPFYACDVETEPTRPFTPLLQRLRCIGFATPDVAMVVGLLSRDGVTRIYPADQERVLLDIIGRFFADPNIPKVGHNFGYFDRLSIRANLGFEIVNLTDTILLHRGEESELPHNLGFVGSTHCDVLDAWKADHTATEAKDDMELWAYNAKDCVVNARIYVPLAMAVQARDLVYPVRIHHQLQEMCAGLHQVGMFIDQDRRRAHETSLKISAERHRRTMREIIGNAEFNPNSRDQVATVLFERWRLTPEVIYSAGGEGAAKKLRKAFTASGAASTGDDHLRAMLLHIGGKTDRESVKQREFIRSLRFFRRDVKVLGTNIKPLRRIDEPWSDEIHPDAIQGINIDTEEGAAAVDYEDEEALEVIMSPLDGKGPLRREGKKKAKDAKLGLTLLDGRVHPHYNAHSTTSQRLSSSDPNGQNWTRGIRDIVCAMIAQGARVQEHRHDGAPSYFLPDKFVTALIYADEDQLELRFASALARASRYLEVFHTGGDPHDTTCEMLFGAKYKFAGGNDREKMRGFGKRFSYAVLYRATVETVWETITSAENDAGELLFANYTLKEVRFLYDRWLKANPEFISWWDADLSEFKRQGFLREPVLGWRRDFLDGEQDSQNEIANFKCQAGGAAVVHLGTLDFLREVRFGRWGPGTGLIQQGHDALMAEVPVTHAPHSLKYDDKKKKWVLDWCPPKCKCITRELADYLQQCMTIDGSRFGLPVKFTAKAKIGFRWSDF